MEKQLENSSREESSHKKEFFEDLHLLNCFADALLNRGLHSDEQNIFFKNPQASFSESMLSLESTYGLLCYLTQISKVPARFSHLSELHETTNNFIGRLIIRDIDFLLKTKKREHRLLLLQNLDEEDKFFLQIKRLQVFMKAKRVDGNEEKRLYMKAMDSTRVKMEASCAQAEEMIQIVKNSRDEDIRIREALRNKNIQQINALYAKTTPRSSRTLNGYIQSEINKLKESIAEHNAGFQQEYS